MIAVPPLAARELLPGLETPDEFRAIVNAHFRVEPPRGQPAILGVVNGFIEWLFAYPDRLSVTISNADRLIDRPRDELAAWIWREAAALSSLPAELPPWRIVKEKRATFAATPAAKRQASPFPDAVGQYRACRRLDADRPARHDRRRGAFGL